MTRLEQLHEKIDGMEGVMAEARARMAVAKPAVDAASDEFAKAGRPQDGSHPARLSWEAALRDLDAAHMNYNSLLQVFQSLRGQLMQEETLVHGSVGTTARIARTAPPPDVEQVAQAARAMADEAAAKKAAAAATPGVLQVGEEKLPKAPTKQVVEEAKKK